jgi:DNA repair protein RadA/Sms
MAKSKIRTVFVCQNCGAQRPRWEGKCTDCGEWNSFVEETPNTEAKTRGWSTQTNEARASQIIRLDQSIEEVKFERVSTGFEELDRVLGGGLVQGSFLLLGGSPGIGKSTLLLQMAGGLAKHQQKILYISGEESVSQTGARAQRLGVRSGLIEMCNESNLHEIQNLAKQKRPDVIVIDSIQTVYLPDLQAAPGSVSQVRECAGHLMGLAKQEGITVLLIGHVTKDGNIAGPKVLEHMVDTVLSFDGDITHQFRLLRTIKNRFGPAHELGVFQMSGGGLNEVTNPSELFLEERGENLMGSVVFAAMEGTRPLLCEVQALTVNTQTSLPRRTALGIDVNRLHLLCAVLDRHLGIQMNFNDIFINVVGGLNLEEPATDLAVAAAILSTEGRKAVDSKAVFFGEIGLTGEVRAVSFAEQRIKEATKLGFVNFFMPASNKKHLADLKMDSKCKIHWIKNIRDLQRLI